MPAVMIGQVQAWQETHGVVGYPESFSRHQLMSWLPLHSNAKARGLCPSGGVFSQNETAAEASCAAVMAWLVTYVICPPTGAYT
jgi:hypothetical protein